MTKKIIYIIFIAITINCFGQETESERNISFGVFGIAYPVKVYSGVLLDVSINKNKTLYSSSSLNYAGFFYKNSFSEKHQFSVSSGISWKLQKNRFCFRPGIQLGYLYVYNKNEYTFHGGYGRLSTEFTYLLNRFEYGIQLNFGMGYGPIMRYDSNYNQNLFLFTSAFFGLEVKYHLFE